MTKRCKRCGIEKPIERFHRRSGGYHPECRNCEGRREPMSPRLLAYLRDLVGLGPEGPTKADRDRWREDEKKGASW